MSNIIYVIDGYLSSKDKAEVTLELINQLKKLDDSRKIMLINKFNNSWGIEKEVDFLNCIFGVIGNFQHIDFLKNLLPLVVKQLE